MVRELLFPLPPAVTIMIGAYNKWALLLSDPDRFVLLVNYSQVIACNGGFKGTSGAMPPENTRQSLFLFSRNISGQIGRLLGLS